MFENRQQSGQMLADRLLSTFGRLGLYDHSKIVVVALSPGGVPVAVEVALALQCSLDVILSRKLSAPNNRELEIGAVSSDGVVLLKDEFIAELGLLNGNARILEQQKEGLVSEVKAKEESWFFCADIHPNPDFTGKIVILTDDGISSGMTALTALRTVLRRGSAVRIVAVPVLPYHLYEELREQCDLLYALAVPQEPAPPSVYYQDFHKVEDKEVIDDLKRWSRFTGQDQHRKAS